MIALLCNVALAALKFVVGSLAQSRALIADGFNSAGDVLATFVAWFAFRVGQAPPDANHPYGHQNAETLAGLLVGGMICATGGFVFVDGLQAVLARTELETPGLLAIWAAAFTAVVKETLYRVSMRAGRRTNSPTLLASARDHRADVGCSLVVVAGDLVARAGHPIFDPLAGMVIGVWVFWLGIHPVRQNLAVLMHESHPRLARAAAEAASTVPGVVRVGQVRVHPLGGQYRMDLVLEVDGQMSVAAAHAIAHEVERTIRAGVEHVNEVHVHVEPAE